MENCLCGGNVIPHVSKRQNQFFSPASQDGDQYEIDHCLAHPALDSELTNKCSLQYSPVIMIGVLLANFAKFTCILVFVLSYREPVLATIGDGIASFLERPDTFTENEKLEAQYRDSRASWRVWFQKPRLAFGWWHWWQAPSKFRWFGSLIS